MHLDHLRTGAQATQWRRVRRAFAGTATRVLGGGRAVAVALATLLTDGLRQVLGHMDAEQPELLYEGMRSFGMPAPAPAVAALSVCGARRLPPPRRSTLRLAAPLTTRHRMRYDTRRPPPALAPPPPAAAAPSAPCGPAVRPPRPACLTHAAGTDFPLENGPPIRPEKIPRERLGWADRKSG